MQSDDCTYDHLDKGPANQTPEVILMFLKGTLQDYIPDSDCKREIQGISGRLPGEAP
ncbi:MAG: hypothetical protein ABSB74_05735 [Tepidisphaeraceae bacterium]